MSIPGKSGAAGRRARLRDPQFHARLRRLIGRERPYAWADRVGISKGAFTRIWREGSVPTSELLHRIRRATGVSLDWLLTGEEAAERGAAAGLATVAMYAPGGPGRRRAAHPIALAEAWLKEWLDARPEHLACVVVRGEAMAPALGDGDLALVDRRVTRPEPDGLFAIQQGGTLHVRRVQRIAAGRYQALADNPRFRTFTFGLSARTAVVGRVVWVGKRL